MSWLLRSARGCLSAIQRRFQDRLDRSRSYLEGVATALNETVKNKAMPLFRHLVNSMFRQNKQRREFSNVFQRMALRNRLRIAATTNKDARI
jgi:hypothetical protein